MSCGHICSDDDRFCSHCGSKINPGENYQIEMAINNFDSNEKLANKQKDKMSFNGKRIKNIFANHLINISLFLILVLCILSIVTLFALKKHDIQQNELQYKNYVENPSLIPILKEPMTYEGFAQNLTEVEEFLLMYLKKSSDDQTKKSQIFLNYLNQLEKVPNILNEKYSNQNISACSNVKNAQACVKKLNDIFSKNGFKLYTKDEIIFLYPNYKNILKIYSKYLPLDIVSYIDLQSSYNYPISLNLELNIKPKKLADKIYDFENLYLTIKNETIKEKLEKILYDDFRKFIFTPSIYSTITQEMKQEYKNAYKYFINTKDKSNLRTVVMSYLDKKRAYNEDNFKNDYPYKIFDVTSFDENYIHSTMQDIFEPLRKNIFAKNNSDLKLAFVYDVKTLRWEKYEPNVKLTSGEYLFSEPDANNNVSIYNHAFSPIQELNILKYSKMYLISNNLYVFNKNKLALSKITFNGKTFNLYTLNQSDITSLFPGIEVINIDTFPSYNILIEKENANASYFLYSRYSQGWNNYNLTPVKGEINILTLPNMFSVYSNSEVILSFEEKNIIEEGFSENKPSYKFVFRTYGHEEKKASNENYTHYDEKVKNEEVNSINHKPNIMPKMIENNENIELENGFLVVPEQKIEPPLELDND